MNIFKVTHIDSGKVYIGYAINDNPNYLGSGKYIKRAVRDFGTSSFIKEVLKRYDGKIDIVKITKDVDKFIKKFKSDNPKFGFNEKVIDLIPKKKKLTKKIQVLLSKEDEDVLNFIIIEKSMENNTKPLPISKYVRQIILEHIAQELEKNKIIEKLKSNI